MPRIKFKKVSNAIYMSHLDLTRCMARAFRRARIPVWNTKGFNPHPYMVFSAPLSLGIAGTNELLDIKLDYEMPLSEIKESLNKTLPSGIEISDIIDDERTFNDIAFASYNIKIEHISKKEFEDFWNAPEIFAEKRTKKSFVSVNLKEEMKVFDIYEENGFIHFSVICACSNIKNVSPFLLTGKFTDKYNEIERTGFYDSNMVNF